MSDVPENLTGAGRDVLLRLIADLVRERDTYAENLTATQARCTELLEEARAARREAHDALDDAAGLKLRVDFWKAAWQEESGRVEALCEMYGLDSPPDVEGPR